MLRDVMGDMDMGIFLRYRRDRVLRLRGKTEYNDVGKSQGERRRFWEMQKLCEMWYRGIAMYGRSEKGRRRKTRVKEKTKRSQEVSRDESNA